MVRGHHRRPGVTGAESSWRVMFMNASRCSGAVFFALRRHLNASIGHLPFCGVHTTRLVVGHEIVIVEMVAVSSPWNATFTFRAASTKATDPAQSGC